MTFKFNPVLSSGWEYLIAWRIFNWWGIEKQCWKLGWSHQQNKTIRFKNCTSSVTFTQRVDSNPLALSLLFIPRNVSPSAKHHATYNLTSLTPYTFTSNCRQTVNFSRCLITRGIIWKHFICHFCFICLSSLHSEEWIIVTNIRTGNRIGFFTAKNHCRLVQIIIRFYPVFTCII